MTEHATPVADTDGFPEHMEIATANPGRAITVIAVSFLLSIAATFVLGWIYTQGGNPAIEGMMLAVVFGGIGFGMAAWGKWLMPKGPFVEEREVLTTEENQEKFAKTFTRGQVAIEGRRSVLLKLLLAAMGTMTAILLFPIRSLTGKNPDKVLYQYGSGWKAGSQLVTDEGKPVHSDDLEVGGVLTVFPPDSGDMAMDQTLLIRAAAAPLPFNPSATPGGYVAYSKVCTHAGCPVGQYQAQFGKLLCPCHGSTFDVLHGADVVFGPAPRPLALLPLMVDDNGYLRAQRGYDEPLGPGFWSRGGVR
ncbi:MAG TPA: Rieske 2Fe-2S domain-containing protein [Acidimicrobiales bacterium]|nr:Rieske 2Fe-2S domain-containing protein [Acidimicrobiales bacterium]